MPRLAVIPTSRLKSDRVNPWDFDFVRLVDSIRLSGWIAPLVVTPMRDSADYLVIDGARRLAAARALSIHEVPAQILENDVDANQIKALGAGYKPRAAQMKAALRAIIGENPDWTLGELAGYICQPPRAVKKLLKWHLLPDDLQAKLDTGELTVGSTPEGGEKPGPKGPRSKIRLKPLKDLLSALDRPEAYVRMEQVEGFKLALLWALGLNPR